MTIAHRQGSGLQRNKWKCDICGKVDVWNDDWWSYGSYAIQETCPDDMPTACSDQCMEKMEQKIKSGEFVLPKVKISGYTSRVTRERQGY